MNKDFEDVERADIAALESAIIERLQNLAQDTESHNDSTLNPLTLSDILEIENAISVTFPDGETIAVGGQSDCTWQMSVPVRFSLVRLYFSRKIRRQRQRFVRRKTNLKYQNRK